MDTVKKTEVPKEGPHGVDRWTSNGYGLVVDGIKVKSPEEYSATKKKERDNARE